MRSIWGRFVEDRWGVFVVVTVSINFAQEIEQKMLPENDLKKLPKAATNIPEIASKHASLGKKLWKTYGKLEESLGGKIQIFVSNL